MIAKRIAIKPGNDSYARLAEYIQAADHDGEKSLMAWCTGCFGGEDYAEGIEEAVDVQAMNTRSRKEKTYHLVISFRPEDESRLTPEIFKAMEERFAAALGYADHQRHCGVHKNTGNIHMHMAYNTVHPEKHTRYEPFRDFYKLSAICRELEQEYDLTVDNGITPGHEPTRPNQKAALVEAHTGQQSFDSYAGEHREAILHSLENAASWRDVHTALAACGMEIKPHGNGMVIKDRHSGRSHAMKASSLDRSLSRGNLEARFGGYESPHGLEVQERSRYDSAPLHRSPERGELFTKYRQGIESRKTRLEDVRQRESTALAAIRKRWTDKRAEIERMGIAKRNKRNLLTLARKHEAEAIAKARLAAQPEREAVRRDIPFSSWSGFLRHEAGHGNEIALAVLRSKGETVEPEQEAVPPKVKDWSQHGREQFLAGRADHAAKERALLEREDLSAKAKNPLQAFLRMERVVEEAKAQGYDLGDITQRIDGKGVVIFTLASGGSIRDTGKELFYSTYDEKAHGVALAYAALKWGKHIVQEKGKILFRQAPEVQREQKRGWSR